MNKQNIWICFLLFFFLLCYNNLFKKLKMRLIQQEYRLPEQGIRRLIESSTQLIVSICQELTLPLRCCHYSLWIFHANSIILRFQNIDRFVYLCASLILATKLGQHLKRSEEVVRVWRKMIRKMMKKPQIEDDEQIIKRLKRKIFEAEINLMITFSFDLDIKIATQYLQPLQELINQDLFSATRKCITDFYKTQLVVYYQPHLIMLTCLKISSLVLKMNLNELNGKPWYQFYSPETTLEKLQQIESHFIEYKKGSINL